MYPVFSVVRGVENGESSEVLIHRVNHECPGRGYQEATRQNLCDRDRDVTSVAGFMVIFPLLAHRNAPKAILRIYQ